MTGSGTYRPPTKVLFIPCWCGTQVLLRAPEDGTAEVDDADDADDADDEGSGEALR